MKIKFIAKDLSGKTVRGLLEAANVKAGAAELRDQKMIPLKLSEVRKGGSNINIFGLTRGVSGAELTNFTRQLATMITAGLPLTDALNLLKVQSSQALSIVIAGILGDVQSGLALSAAMAKHPKVFDKVYVALVKAGESAGLMEKILNRLADTSEKNREFKGKVVGAMIYPIIIIIAMMGVMVLMVVMVIPKMKDLYNDFGSDLPLETKVLMAISDFCINWWWVVLIVIGLIVMGARAFMSTDYGKNFWARFVTKIPIIGSLIKESTLTEFSRIMALLLTAGVSVVEALRISADSLGNIVAKKDVEKIANQVEKGFPVSISFSESETFPQIFGQMVAVGEETGKMDEVLTKLSYYFESETDQKVKGLTTAIEPIILIVMAVGVGFLMYAIIMPLYEITNKV
jgi:type II secretory pathway component PulF